MFDYCISNGPGRLIKEGTVDNHDKALLALDEVSKGYEMRCHFMIEPDADGMIRQIIKGKFTMTSMPTGFVPGGEG